MQEVKNNKSSQDTKGKEIEYICPLCSFSVIGLEGGKLLCKTKNCYMLMVPDIDNVVLKHIKKYSVLTADRL